jgi:hypothetical protein
MLPSSPQSIDSVRLTLLRITIVEAKNLALLERSHQHLRPYVALRAGQQHGQTRVSTSWHLHGDRRTASTCDVTWNQSFDLVLRQHPNSVDLEDFLSIRVLNYHMARSDSVLGKVDVAVATLGDPFRPPETGILFASPSLQTSLPNIRPRIKRSRGLAHRSAQDVWLPLTGTSPHGDTIHTGEMRLRILILPIPSSHRLHHAHVWLTMSTKPPSASSVKV